MAVRKRRFAPPFVDPIVAELGLRNLLLTPQPYDPKVRVVPRGVTLSLPLCHPTSPDQIDMAVAKVVASG